MTPRPFPVPAPVVSFDEVLAKSVEGFIKRVAAFKYPLNEWGEGFDSFEFEPSREAWVREMNKFISEAHGIVDIKRLDVPYCVKAVANCTLVVMAEQLEEDHAHEFCAAVMECKAENLKGTTELRIVGQSFGKPEYKEFPVNPYARALDDWPWPQDDCGEYAWPKKGEE